MSFQKKINQKIIAPSMLGLKLDRMVRALGGRNLLHVYYHGVISKKDWSYPHSHIDYKSFEKHLSYLKRNFNIISTPEAFSISQSNTGRKKKFVCVGFDDGYKNNLEIMLPIVEKLHIPVTIFAISRAAEDSNYMVWADIVRIPFVINRDKVLKIKGRSYKNFIDIHNGEHIYNVIKPLSNKDRNEILYEIYETFNIQDIKHKVNKEFWEMMDAVELSQAASSSYCTIGSHGVNHLGMDIISDEDLNYEFIHSKSTLERCIGKPVTTFAFPDGAYSPTSIKVAEDSGYKHILVSNYRYNETNPLYHSRYCMPVHGNINTDLLVLNKQFKQYGVSV